MSRVPRGQGKLTLAEMAAQSILDIIKANHISPGQRIPTEAELTDQLGISRSTVREAVRLLVARNILESFRGSGTYLSQKMGMSEDPLGVSLAGDKLTVARDLLQLRRAVEPFFAGLAAKNRSEEEVVKLQSIYLQQKELLLHRNSQFTQDEYQEYLSLDCAFHETIAVASQNAIVGRLIPIICDSIHTMDQSNDKRDAPQSVLEHSMILNAIIAGDPIEATEAMTLHMLMTEAASVKPMML